MKVRCRASLWRTVACACVWVLALPGCKKAAEPPPTPPTVQVLEVTTTNVPLSTEIIGQLDSPQNVEVRARVETFVEKVLFIEGSELSVGAPLFLLDKKPFEERLAAANGMLAEAKAALAKYELDVTRLEPLARKRAVPQQDLDNALASVDAGKANVRSAEARVESAQLDVGYCDVRAPINGLIGAKQVSVGELVGKGDPTLLATMSTLDPIWFYCAVSEVQYLKAQKEIQNTGKKIEELPISLILADGSVHPAGGKFVFIDRAVDVKTGTLRIRAQFPNAEKRLRPGMFARIKVDIGTRRESILVPERSIAELQGNSFVWIIDAENKATQRGVKVGETVGDKVLVVEGIKPGERIVTEGVQKVREGLLVQAKSGAEIAQGRQRPEAQDHEAQGSAGKE